MMSSQTGEEIVNSEDTIFSLRSVLCDVIIFSQWANSITHCAHMQYRHGLFIISMRCHQQLLRRRNDIITHTLRRRNSILTHTLHACLDNDGDDEVEHDPIIPQEYAHTPTHTHTCTHIHVHISV
jgi:hypothetical protein